MTTLLSIQTANPENCLTQTEVYDLVCRHLEPRKRTQDLYRRFLLDGGIKQRYFAWDDFHALIKEDVDLKIERFGREAVDLAVEALEKTLVETGTAPEDLDAIFITTCTGYLCPGLTSYVVEKMGLRENIYAADLVGLGCGGAVPALRAAGHFIAAHPRSKAAVISVEICSAAVHWAEEAELILSNAIFGDGAAAVLLAGEGTGLQIEQMESVLWPQYREQLRFRYLESRLCNVISPRVCDIAAEAVAVLKGRLQLNGHTSYAFHAGGRRVLDAVQARSGFSDAELAGSRQVLRDFGNMSSPSILYVLKELIEHPPQHGRLAGFTFGAGFSAYGFSGRFVQ